MTLRSTTGQQLRIHGFSISLDGYAAGPGQSMADPVGVGGRRLHQWMFQTRTFAERFGTDGTEEGIDDEVVRTDFDNIGASIIGRNMFGPVRGPWREPSWDGWWGKNPPFHHPVFVLTHYKREPLHLEGGTVFHFVTGGIDEARERALAAADGRDVRVGGGVSTVREMIRRQLVDRIGLTVVPVLLGRGERLFETSPLDTPTPGYECVSLVASERVVHVQLERTEEYPHA